MGIGDTMKNATEGLKDKAEDLKGKAEEMTGKAKGQSEQGGANAEQSADQAQGGMENVGQEATDSAAGDESQDAEGKAEQLAGKVQQNLNK